MAQFDYLFSGAEKRENEASIRRSFRDGVVDASKITESQLSGAFEAVRKDLTVKIGRLGEQIDAATKAASDGQADTGQRAIKAVETSTASLSEAVQGLLDHVSSLEAQIVAEIKAIPKPKDVVIPKPDKVDLQPVLDAIRNQKYPEMPKVPVVIDEKKTQWTFEFIRDKRTGLLERVIAT